MVDEIVDTTTAPPLAARIAEEISDHVLAVVGAAFCPVIGA